MMRMYLAGFNVIQSRRLAMQLEDADHKVVDCSEFNALPDYDARADARLDVIIDCDMFVFLAPIDSAPLRIQLLRNTELGIAIGAEVPVTFIGKPHNAYQRFGDIFDSPEEFVAAWCERKKA